MKASSLIVIILISSFLYSTDVFAQGEIDVESGLVFTGYNNVRIPGDRGTLLSLKNDLKPETEFFYRLRASYTINSRHTLSILYAPLVVNSQGETVNRILFEGVSFPENSRIDATYIFNSYRLTYRYRLVNTSKLSFGIGFTAKIRDAKIALTSSDLNSEKSNIGFVPILNFSLLYNFNEKAGAILDGDALAAPQGRAEDVLLAFTYNLSSKTRIRAGYRILEGGADNDEVYSFALFHYLTIGLTYNFLKKE